MKYGFRTPSFSRSLSAATKGAAKRALMREIVPNYGKRGMGWANPKKAAYNRVYNMTTASITDFGKKSANRTSSISQCHDTATPKGNVSNHKDLPVWLRVLLGIAALGGFILLIWLIIEVFFPIGLILLFGMSFLFAKK